MRDFYFLRPITHIVLICFFVTNISWGISAPAFASSDGYAVPKTAPEMSEEDRSDTQGFISALTDEMEEKGRIDLGALEQSGEAAAALKAASLGKAEEVLAVLRQNPVFIAAEKEFANQKSAQVDNKNYWDDIELEFERTKLQDDSLDHHIDRFMKLLGDPSKSILDIGMGIGRVADMFLKNGYSNYYGIDIAAAGITEARKRLEGKIDPARLILADIKTYDPEGKKFDGIFASDILLYLSPEDQVRVLVKISEMLKEDGVLFVRWAPDKDGKNKIVSKTEAAVPGWVFLATPDYIQTLLVATGLSQTAPIQQEIVLINKNTSKEKLQPYLPAFAQKTGDNLILSKSFPIGSVDLALSIAKSDLIGRIWVNWEESFRDSKLLNADNTVTTIHFFDIKDRPNTDFAKLNPQAVNGTPLTSLLKVPYGNLFSNDHFVAYQNGVLYCQYLEPLDKRQYPSFVLWKDGNITLETLTYRMIDGKWQVYTARQKDPITDKVALAVFGQPLIVNDKIADIKNLIPYFSDMNHVFQFPKIPLLNRPWKGEKDSYAFVARPNFVANKTLAQEAYERPVTIKVPAQVKFDRAGNLAQVDMTNLAALLAEQTFAVLDKKGALALSAYQPRASMAAVQQQGDFYFDPLTQELTMWYPRSLYYHNFLGIRNLKDGKKEIVSILTRPSELGKARGLTLEGWAKRLEEVYGLSSVIVLANGGDMMMDINGAPAVKSFKARVDMSAAINFVPRGASLGKSAEPLLANPRFASNGIASFIPLRYEAAEEKYTVALELASAPTAGRLRYDFYVRPGIFPEAVESAPASGNYKGFLFVPVDPDQKVSGKPTVEINFDRETQYPWLKPFLSSYFAAQIAEPLNSTNPALQLAPRGVPAAAGSSLGSAEDARTLDYLKKEVFVSLQKKPVAVAISLAELNTLIEKQGGEKAEIVGLFLRGWIELIVTDMPAVDKTLLPPVLQAVDKEIEPKLHLLTGALTLQKFKSIQTVRDVLNDVSADKDRKVIYVSDKTAYKTTSERIMSVQTPYIGAAVAVAAGNSVYRAAFEKDGATGFWVPTELGRLLMSLVKEFLSAKVVAHAA